MLTEKILKGKNIYLRQIKPEDCTETYVSWLNDPVVNRYLETRFVIQTRETVRDFVNEQRESSNTILFAITLKVENKHIGNIKIGPINHVHKFADVSYFIGEKTCWGKGIATEAIRLATIFGFDELELRRVEAGAYSKAVGSWKALEKNGFIREGTFRKKVLLDENIYDDVYRYGILKGEMDNH